MNVTFHTIGALATAAVLSARDVDRGQKQSSTRNHLPVLVVGFLAGVILHGFLDLVPHSYPIKSSLDVFFSLALFAAATTFAKPRHRPLICACYLGCIFPDLIDLGPAVVNKMLGWSIPVVKIFPWHWRQYSGSIYDGSRGAESSLAYIAVAVLSVSLLYVFRAALFAYKGHD